MGAALVAAVTQRTVTTPDGRALAIEEAGDPAGRPVLVHNGTPNSRHIFAPVAADARAICAGLGISRLAMWGISGGGPTGTRPGHLTLLTKRIGEVRSEER